jgi:hypothetical protein
VTPYDFSRQTGTEAANMFGRDEEFPKEGSTIKQISFTREGSNPALYYLGREKLLDTGIFFDPEKVSLAQLDGTTVAVVQVIHGEKRITHTFDLLSTAEIEPLVTQYIERYTAEHGHAPSKKDISARSFVGASIMKDRLKSYTVTDYLDFLPKDISTGMKEEVLKLTHNYDYMTKQLRLSLAETGVHMAQLPWKDQLIIGASLTMYGNEKEAKKFLKKYGDHGLKTFSSILRGGKEMGDKILLLGEKLPEDAARVLFGTYSKIVDASAEVADIVRENLGDKATPEMLQSIKEKLLVRGKNLLEENADKVSACEGVACEDIGTKLIEELELAKTSAYAFSEVCKLLVEKGEFSFEDFKDIELAYDRSPLPEKMKEEILTMHRENTKPYPDGLREHWRGTLREGLEKENEKQLVVSVKYKGDVIAVMRVIEQEDGSWYGASFNVNPTVKGSRIGTELLKKVIDDLAKDKPFVAHCYAENPMLDTYINKFGFVISNTQEDYHGTGATVHKITLSAT